MERERDHWTTEKATHTNHNTITSRSAAAAAADDDDDYDAVRWMVVLRLRAQRHGAQHFASQSQHIRALWVTRSTIDRSVGDRSLRDIFPRDMERDRVEESQY